MIRKIFISTAVLCIALTTLNNAANAQTERWARRYQKPQVDRMIRDVERASNDLRRNFDAFLDRSKLDGSVREDRYNSKVVALEQALNQLRAEFDRRDSWWETRTNVQEALRVAKPVATMFRRQEFKQGIRTDWNRLRLKLNVLASTYNLPRI